MTDVISNTGAAATMADNPAWTPVIPTSDLGNASSIALGFIKQAELALWRAPNGVVQAWENRCPHRGMRFTLGRIIQGRLSCAYHGWEFEAGSGRCSAIPAHPDMPVPRNVCARKFQAAEVNGIVWVAHEHTAEAPPATAAHTILRSLGVRASAAFVTRTLSDTGWRLSKHDVFDGDIDDQQVVLYLTCVAAELVMLHVGVVNALDTMQKSRLHAGLRDLRAGIETRWQIHLAAHEGEQP